MSIVDSIWKTKSPGSVLLIIVIFVWLYAVFSIIIGLAIHLVATFITNRRELWRNQVVFPEANAHYLNHANNAQIEVLPIDESSGEQDAFDAP